MQARTIADGSSDPRLAELRALLEAAADAPHAASQRAYHKSRLPFYGLTSQALRDCIRRVFPVRPRLARERDLPVIAALWASPAFEERSAALRLLERLVPQLEPSDLDWLESWTRDCEGWAHLDELAVGILSRLALAHGAPIYARAAGWLDDGWLWTRRAAILVHVRPARLGRLSHDYAWPSFEARLAEREFFIRKAIGWLLRECCRHYPQAVHDFLRRVGDRASGLTRREGSRRLPESLRRSLLDG